MPGIPYDRTSVISNAFVILGKRKITSIPDGGPVAQDADSIYDQLLAAELSNPNWRFSTHVQTLSKLAGADPDYKGFHSAYQKPSGLLALWQIYPKTRYEIFQDQIWTSGGNQTIQVEYRKVGPESQMPPAFINYFVFVLAYNLGIALTENSNILSRIESRLNEARARAMAVNSQEHNNKSIQDSPWIANRGDGYGGFWGGI